MGNTGGVESVFRAHLWTRVGVSTMVVCMYNLWVTQRKLLLAASLELLRVVRRCSFQSCLCNWGVHIKICQSSRLVPPCFNWSRFIRPSFCYTNCHCWKIILIDCVWKNLAAHQQLEFFAYLLWHNYGDNHISSIVWRLFQKNGLNWLLKICVLIIFSCVPRLN